MNFASKGPTLANCTSQLALMGRNTLGIESYAEQAIVISKSEQIPSLLQDIKAHGLPLQVLGGGSNVVLPKLVTGVTLLIDIAGKEILSSDELATLVRVGAGEHWHDFVQWTLAQGFPGMENLALIPGTVGASPIQNIGAYGLEVANFIECVEAFDTEKNGFVTLSNQECEFAYRDSYFKRHPRRFIITHITFNIPKVWSAVLTYAELVKQFSNQSPTPTEIFNAVCAIRSSKLPDPKVLGNAGSFFQNSIVSEVQCTELAKQYPAIVSFPDAAGQRKLAAGWLIDQCGFKGKRIGPVGVYDKQALVLVNYGGGSAQDILGLAKQIQDKVHETFGVQLQIEPNIF
jgi:UDP-N-acetylmuramate dehydrogenase